MKFIKYFEVEAEHLGEAILKHVDNEHVGILIKEDFDKMFRIYELLRQKNNIIIRINEILGE